eukprot:GHVN01060151.1.p1 GENE.GHVN01060151.1~~GHVN01060151.1.p1  ORF type:complete len:777 (+),score=142.81 GHVN01060151.1:997-3327(+)
MSSILRFLRCRFGSGVPPHRCPEDCLFSCPATAHAGVHMWRLGITSIESLPVLADKSPTASAIVGSHSANMEEINALKGSNGGACLAVQENPKMNVCANETSQIDARDGRQKNVKWVSNEDGETKRGEIPFGVEYETVEASVLAGKAEMALDGVEGPHVATVEAERGQFAPEETVMARSATGGAERACVVAEEAARIDVTSDESEQAARGPVATHPVATEDVKREGEVEERPFVAKGEAATAVFAAEKTEQPLFAADEVEGLYFATIQADREQSTAEKTEAAHSATVEEERSRVAAEKNGGTRFLAEDSDKAQPVAEMAEGLCFATEEANKNGEAEGIQTPLAAEDATAPVPVERAEALFAADEENRALNGSERARARDPEAQWDPLKGAEADRTHGAAKKAEKFCFAMEEATKGGQTEELKMPFVAEDGTVKAADAAEHDEKAHIASEVVDGDRLGTSEAPQRTHVVAEEAALADVGSTETVKALMNLCESDKNPEKHCVSTEEAESCHVEAAEIKKGFLADEGFTLPPTQFDPQDQNFQKDGGSVNSPLISSKSTIDESPLTSYNSRRVSQTSRVLPVLNDKLNTAHHDPFCGPTPVNDAAAKLTNPESIGHFRRSMLTSNEMIEGLFWDSTTSAYVVIWRKEGDVKVRRFSVRDCQQTNVSAERATELARSKAMNFRRSIFQKLGSQFRHVTSTEEISRSVSYGTNHPEALSNHLSHCVSLASVDDEGESHLDSIYSHWSSPKLRESRSASFSKHMTSLSLARGEELAKEGIR